MSKINLIIADPDNEYLEEISKFFACKASMKFRIISFSKKDRLFEYLENNSENIDILLINPEMHDNSSVNKIKGIIIFFTTKEIINKDENINFINKYQKADDILNKIIEIYSNNSNDLFLSGISSHKTKIIAVYSASGGVGKSLISAVSSVISVKKGQTSMYLNMENLQSTFRYFNKTSEKSISNLIFYLKDKKNKLSQKIEEIRCIDEKSGVHFFSPPESSLEIENMNSEDIKYLFREIKGMGFYDSIYIDMSVDFNDRNIEIMEEADLIYFILNNDEICEIKKNEYIRQVEILREKKDILNQEKLILVVNNRNSDTDDNYLFYETKEIIQIPFNTMVSKCKSAADVYGASEEFDFALEELNKKVL